MAFAFPESRRIKKESEFVRLLKTAPKLRNEFFFCIS